MHEIERYVEEVLCYVSADPETHHRLREQETQRLAGKYYGVSFEEICFGEGKPEERARAIMARLGVQPNGAQPYYYEYRSRASLFGLPLVHVNVSHGRGKPRRAKGILAIGDIATGGVAIGGMSAGGLALGGVSVGLISLGGIAAGLLALGGMAAGLLSIGGMAYGIQYALGGVAIAGQAASGGAALAPIAIREAKDGLCTLVHNGVATDLAPMQNAAALLRETYPSMPDWLIFLMTLS